MVKPIAYPEIYPPEEEAYHPIAISHTMYPHGRTRRGRHDPRAPRDVDRDDGRRAAPGPRGAVARVPAEATAFAHRRNRIMVNVAALREGRGPGDARAVGPRVRRGAAPGRRRRLRELPRRRGARTHPRRVSGRHVGPPSNDQGALRSDEPVPPQPEHPTGGGARVMSQTTTGEVTSKDGTRIVFERTGEGPPVILVGGALSDRRAAAPFAAELAGLHHLRVRPAGQGRQRRHAAVCRGARGRGSRRVDPRRRRPGVPVRRVLRRGACARDRRLERRARTSSPSTSRLTTWTRASRGSPTTSSPGSTDSERGIVGAMRSSTS